MKYIKEYNEIIGRISDNMFKILSDRLGIRESDKFNKFYISDISCYRIEQDMIDCVEIHFYNSNLVIFGSKIIKVFFTKIVDDYNTGDLVQFYGEVGKLKNKKIIDVQFSKDTFQEIKDFLKEDSPKCYDVIKSINIEDLRLINRKLKRRI